MRLARRRRALHVHWLRGGAGTHERHLRALHRMCGTGTASQCIGGGYRARWQVARHRGRCRHRDADSRKRLGRARAAAAIGRRRRGFTASRDNQLVRRRRAGLPRVGKRRGLSRPVSSLVGFRRAVAGDGSPPRRRRCDGAAACSPLAFATCEDDRSLACRREGAEPLFSIFFARLVHPGSSFSLPHVAARVLLATQDEGRTIIQGHALIVRGASGGSMPRGAPRLRSEIDAMSRAASAAPPRRRVRGSPPRASSSLLLLLA